MSIEDKLIVIKAQGPWNDEYIKSLHQTLFRTYQAVDTSNYGILLNLHGEALAVESGFKRHLSFLKKAKIRAVALNLADCDTRGLTKTLFSRIYSQASIRHATHTDEQTARAWLLEQLRDEPVAGLSTDEDS